VQCSAHSSPRLAVTSFQPVPPQASTFRGPGSQARETPSTGLGGSGEIVDGHLGYGGREMGPPGQPTSSALVSTGLSLCLQDNPAKL
jgi:hypothetical protein